MAILDVLFLCSYVINFSVTCAILYTCLTRYTTVFLIAHSMYPGFFDKLAAIQFVVAMYARQWLKKNVKKLANDEYEVTHVINGELMRARLKRVLPRVVDAQDYETEESVMQDAQPYLTYRQVPWTSKKLIYYYEDGTSSEVIY